MAPPTGKQTRPPLRPEVAVAHRLAMHNGDGLWMCRRCSIGRGGSKAWANVSAHLWKDHNSAYLAALAPPPKVLSEAEALLQQQWQELGLPEGDVQFRQVYGFLFDPNRKYAKVIFCPIPNQEVNHNIVELKATMDEQLPWEQQVSFEAMKLVKKEKSQPPGWDLGHVLARRFLPQERADFEAVNKTSIMALQSTAFNRGKWCQLEEYLAFLCRRHYIRVVVGVYGSQDITGDDGNVAVEPATTVPEFFWMLIIIGEGLTNLHYDCFHFPNNDCPEDMQEYRLSLEQLETRLGLLLLSNLRDMKRTNILPAGLTEDVASLQTVNREQADMIADLLEQIKVKDRELLQTQLALTRVRTRLHEEGGSLSADTVSSLDLGSGI